MQLLGPRFCIVIFDGLQCILTYWLHLLLSLMVKNEQHRSYYQHSHRKYGIPLLHGLLRRHYAKKLVNKNHAYSKHCIHQEPCNPSRQKAQHQRRNYKRTHQKWIYLLILGPHCKSCEPEVNHVDQRNECIYHSCLFAINVQFFQPLSHFATSSCSSIHTTTAHRSVQICRFYIQFFP